MSIYEVELTKKALNDVKKIPKYIVIKLMAWMESVGEEGIEKVRKTPGFHDEPLKGKLKGLRSIRLSKSYRAIYKIDKNNNIEIIKVVEVNKHEY
jgi:toxin HigB-1